jgi:hypothetical protein
MAARVQWCDGARPPMAAAMHRMKVGDEARTMATWSKRAGRACGFGGGGGFCWVCFHSRETISAEGAGALSLERDRLVKWSMPRECAAGPGVPPWLGGPRRWWEVG